MKRMLTVGTATYTTRSGLLFLALALGAAMAALVALATVGVEPAHAAAKTFTVNSTGDGQDANNGDGICATISDECTFRAAIEQANKTKGKDTINFAIPGAGPHTISPASQLPAITKPLNINGYSEALDEGANPAKPNEAATGTDAVLKIVLDGNNATNVGLWIQANNVTARGLVINGFFHGVRIEGGDNNVIAGNFIGTDVLGTTPSPNLGDGVLIFGTENKATNNTIGGTTPDKRNLIAGNGRFGVLLAIGARGTKVQGNLIGTKTGLDGDLGNAVSGILTGSVEGSGNTIGGEGAASNTIAFNASDGVSVSSGTGYRILSNSIFFNGGLGIDLGDDGRTDNGDDGVTANDDKDPDTGANNRQNFPAISSAVTSGGSTTITGSLNSTPGKRFTLQFFSMSSQAADPSGFGEGQTFLGQTKVETDKQGNASFSFVPEQAVPLGQRVTATATGSGGTSEFSQAVTVG